jgi:hypothetical protein
MRVVRGTFSALLIAAFFSTPSFAATPDRIVGVIDSSRGVALQKSLHPKAQAKYDQGPVEPSFRLDSLMLLLAPSPTQQKALDELVAEQQDRSSPNYHKWLTPVQYAQQFGLSRNDLSKITSWLQSEGFTIQTIGAGHNRLVFSGTAGAVQSAFKAEIHRYNVDGEEHFSNSTPIMIPAALNGIVSGIIGVNDFRMRPASRFRMGSASRARPDYYESGLVFPNFLAPGDVYTIYDIPSSLDGSGQKIGIIGETDVFIQDINDFRSAFGLTPITTSNCTFSTVTSPGVITACNDPHFKYILYLPAGGTDPQKPDSVQQGDIMEADLDLEWSGAAAPNAQIVFINAPYANGNGVDDSLGYALDPPAGTSIPAYIVSMSYGLCEAQSTSLETLLEQGISEGVTIVNSAGDTGAAACDGNPPGGANAALPYKGAEDGLAVNYPASSKYVVAAGGTGISLANDSYPNPSSYWGTSNSSTGGSATSYIPELAWNDNEIFADYCQDPYPGDTFCTEGNPVTTGWVKITNAQTAQEDIWISSGGGGASNCFTKSGTTCVSGSPQPSWQTGLSVPSAPTGVRWVPDVAFLASPNFPGYILCTPQNPDAATPAYTSTCVNGISGSTGAIEAYSSIVGGTSASSPLFAAIVALINQKLATPSTNGLGDIHPTLYKLAATPSNNYFHHVTSADNMVYCQSGLPTGQPSGIVCPNSGVFGYEASNADATTGYNLVTGLGSVDVSNLATAWAATIAPNFSLSSSTAPTSVAAGTTTTATITVTPVSGSNFTGAVTLSCSGLPSGITCGSFSPSSVSLASGSGTATVTISVAPNVATGAATVTVTGAASGSPSATATVSFAVTATTETFCLSSNLVSGCSPATAPTISVKQGATANLTLTVNSTNGFVVTSGGNSTTALPLTYTDTESPTVTLSNLTFNPVSPNSSATVSVSVTTTASTTAQARPLDTGKRIFYAALLPGLFGIVFIGGSRRRSLRGMRMLGLIMVLGASTLWLGSCGGSNNTSTGTPGTPPGNYTITLNATTGGAVPLTGSYQFTLTVTQ